MPPDNKESGITPLSASDGEMLAAMQHARETFPGFLREIEADSHRIIPALSSVLVKAYFSDADKSDEGEHMWVTDVESDGQIITGSLCDTPRHVRCVQQGQLVHFPLER